MKKLLALLALTATVSSCHNDDDTTLTQPTFFNLAEGNLWVYKRYNVNSSGEHLQNTPADTVKVVGQEVINGLSYYKLRHSNTTLHDEYDYLRVNESGHLVDATGFVEHPGADLAYTDLYNGAYGETSYELREAVEQNIEGSNYTFVPYVGYFTPSAEFPNVAPGIGNVIGYQQGIGRVIEKCRFVCCENDYFEDRLVYYELN
jgi:hypothetical protein